MISKEEILKRREQVKEMHFVRHMSPNEIHQVLKDKWSIDVIYKDIPLIGKELADQLDKQTVQEIMFKNTQVNDKLINRMWREYDRCQEPEARSRILMRISHANSNYLNDLIRLGRVPVVAQQLEVSIGKGIEEGYKAALKREEEDDKLRKLALKRFIEGKTIH